MRILSKYDVFIFDWDDTLADPKPFPSPAKMIFRDIAYDAAVGCQEMFKPDKNLNGIEDRGGGLYPLIYDAYSIFFHPKLKPGAARLLELLKRNRKKVILFSDGKHYRIMKELKALGVDKYFDAIISVASTGHKKPDPTGILLAERKVKAKTVKCVYIGDLRTDILTARFAGIGSCAISDGLDSYEKLKAAKPDYVFSDLGSFLQALKK